MAWHCSTDGDGSPYRPTAYVDHEHINSIDTIHRSIQLAPLSSHFLILSTSCVAFLAGPDAEQRTMTSPCPDQDNLADNGSASSSSLLISTILSTTSDRDACLSTLVSRHLSTTSSLLAEIDALDQFRRTCPSLYHKVRALFFLYALHRFHLPKQMESEEIAGSNSKSSHSSNLICPLGYEALLDRRFDEAIDHFLVACGSASANAADDEDDDGNTTNKYCRQTSSMPSLSSLATDEGDGEDESSGSGSVSNISSPGRPRHIPSLACHPPTDALSSALAKAYHSLALQTLADQVRSSVRSSEGNEWLFAPTTENADDDDNNSKAFNHPRRITAPELLQSNSTLR